MTELLECRGLEFYELGKGLTQSGVSLRLQLRGQSMYPFVRDGDLAEIVPILMEQVRTGDVVFFRSGSRLLAHRVVRRVNEGRSLQLVTQGDSLPVADKPIDDDANLLGRVEVVYRHGRAIRLNQGLVGLVGRWMGRNRRVHRWVQWVGCWLRRFGRLF